MSRPDDKAIFSALPEDQKDWVHSDFFFGGGKDVLEGECLLGPKR